MTVSKKQTQVAQMIDTLRKSEDPIAFTDLCAKVEAKYPQDVNAAMFALEHLGLVKREVDGPAAYTWIGDRPASKRRVAAKAA